MRKNENNYYSGNMSNDTWQDESYTRVGDIDLSQNYTNQSGLDYGEPYKMPGGGKPPKNSRFTSNYDYGAKARHRMNNDNGMSSYYTRQSNKNNGLGFGSGVLITLGIITIFGIGFTGISMAENPNLSTSSQVDISTNNGSETHNKSRTSNYIDNVTGGNNSSSDNVDTTGETNDNSPDSFTQLDKVLKHNIDTKYSTDYKWINFEDLSKYYANLKGQKICTIGKVGDLSTDSIKISSEETGFYYTTFYTSTDYTEYLKALKEKNVIIIGTVGEPNDFGILGNAMTLKNCDIISYTEKENKKYIKNKSDKSFEKYFKVTEDVAKQKGESNISEQDYKKLCKYYDYNDILRNPDKYKEKFCIVSGTVDQTIEGWLSDSIFITDSNGNKWGCVYSYNKGESKILEGDNITVYGELDGTTTSRTLLGKQVTLPYVVIKYR